MTDPVASLQTCLTETSRLVDAVPDDGWAAPTPCPEWTVGDLVGHLVTGQLAVTQALGGAPVAVDDTDLRTAFTRSAQAMAAAFAAPDALERLVTVPFGTVPGQVALGLRTVETLVHGWDLAVATGQPFDPAADDVEAALAFSRRALGDLPADRSPFCAPQPVGDQAPALDRLVALLGRRP